MNSVAVEKTRANSRFKKPWFIVIRNLSILADRSFFELEMIFENLGMQRMRDKHVMISESEATFHSGGQKFTMKYLTDSCSIVETRYPSIILQNNLHGIFTESTTNYQLHQLTWMFFVYEDACKKEIYGEGRFDKKWLSAFYEQYDGAMRSEIINNKWVDSVGYTWLQPEFEKYGITELPVELRTRDYHEFFNF
jgi:hypothetical protein